MVVPGHEGGQGIAPQEVRDGGAAVRQRFAASSPANI
jgi:hypothetical protein